MAAVTATVGTTADTSNVTTYTTASFTPTAGTLLVVLVSSTGSVATAPTVTASANSMTFTLGSTTANYGVGGIHTLYAFVSNQLVPSSPAAMTVTFTCTADASTGVVLFTAAVSGMTNTGSAAIRQMAAENAQVSPNTPTVTFGSACLTGNPVVGITSQVSVNNPGAPASWTERGFLTIATPTSGSEYASIDSGFTSATVTWGGASSGNHGSLALELDASSGATVTVPPSNTVARARLVPQVRAFVALAAPATAVPVVNRARRVSPAPVRRARGKTPVPIIAPPVNNWRPWQSSPSVWRLFKSNAATGAPLPPVAVPVNNWTAPVTTQAKRRWLPARKARSTQPVPPTVVPVPIEVRRPRLMPRRARTTPPVPSIAVPLNNWTPAIPARSQRRWLGMRRGKTSGVIPPVVAPANNWSAAIGTHARFRWVSPRRGRISTVVPPVTVPVNNWSPIGSRSRRRWQPAPRPKSAQPVPPTVVPTVLPPHRRAVLLSRRGRSAVVVLPTLLPPTLPPAPTRRQRPPLRRVIRRAFEFLYLVSPAVVVTPGNMQAGSAQAPGMEPTQVNQPQMWGTG